jgi:hypothetical protein
MKYIYIILCLVFSLNVQAQSEMRTEQAFLFSPNYSISIPGGDMADRFTRFSSLGMGIDFKFENNLVVGVDYDGFFGDGVIDNGIFSNISGPSGFILDKDGQFTTIDLNVRGFNSSLNMGYLWAPNKKESFTGVLMMVGAGFLSHRIEFIAENDAIPQINEEYEKGYDQLTSGLVTKQYIGYQYSTNRNRYRFRLGVEFNQGQTEGRRTWDFNQNSRNDTERLDLITAIKLAIIVPVYTKQAQDEEFFID